MKKYLYPYFWHDLKYKIKCFFNPRNKWVKKAIGNQWHDLDYVYEEILFAGIINYVEGEKCFERVLWKSPEEKATKKKILEIYNWAKTGRDKFKKNVDSAYPEVDLDNLFNVDTDSYNKLYGKVNKLEEELRDKDTEYLVWLVKNRSVLWT